jgi:hypothetical protein
MRIARIKNPPFKKFSQRKLRRFPKCHPGDIIGREYGIAAGNPLWLVFANFDISFLPERTGFFFRQSNY